MFRNLTRIAENKFVEDAIKVNNFKKIIIIFMLILCLETWIISFNSDIKETAKFSKSLNSDYTKVSINIMITLSINTKNIKKQNYRS